MTTDDFAAHPDPGPPGPGSPGPGDVGRTIAVVETRIGHPRQLATTRQGPVTSAIAKMLVEAARVELGSENLAGDDQADRSVHGGPDKSVYCYPAEHAAAWGADGFALAPGSVGENVVTRGATEADVHLGDVWQWGDALVQISQPRAPCFKLALHSGRREIAAAMIGSGRCGWYLRTVRGGEVDTRGQMTLVERDLRNATVADTFAVMFPGQRDVAGDVATVRRVLDSPGLAPEWIRYLRGRNPLAGAG